ncbi:MAG: diphosphate--fructose-6-phosphate 1-phosphotransferase [Ruminococcaceae bacterium]|nr:diphosphate--fructose-6-phosphate 1-phosphotransferase [Oscillospiraceae bacterium]
MRNALYIQSGGPTTVINTSAYGVITACRENSDKIGRLYCAEYGMVGLLNNRLIDVYSEDSTQLELLQHTPSSIFGSCRYHVTDESDYGKILNTLQQHDIGYLFYNGGNGTLRACRDLIRYLDSRNYDCNVVVVPKTVDNDIGGIDHSPGFPSAARHVAITVSELAHDIRVYDTGLITVVEVMGRNTGWLAAATLLSSRGGNGPDLIYTPEVPFETERFLKDIRGVYEQKGKCLAVVAEGVRDSGGKYLFEYGKENAVENPEISMGGVTPYLTMLLRGEFPCKVRGIDLGLMQRCGMHTAAPVDLREAAQLGGAAVTAALNGVSGKMVTLQRVSSSPYLVKESLADVEEICDLDASMPLEYITDEKNYIRESFLDYIEPLVGELPKYANLKMNLA